MRIVSPTTLAVLLGIVGLYVINRYVRSKRNRLPLPPGPKGIFLLGNINDMPKPGVVDAHHWLEHKKLYDVVHPVGPISSVTVMGQTIVIINDSALAFELLRERSAIHSSRPRQVFAGEMVGLENGTAMSPYNDNWRIHRKNVARVLTTNASFTMFEKVQETESAHLLLRVLDSPDDLWNHLRKMTGSVILKITYGYTTVAHGPDPLVELAAQAGQQFGDAITPGKWMVDTLPFLRHLPNGFPGTSFKKTAEVFKDTMNQCVETPYAFVKQQMREKRHKTSYLSQAIEDIGDDAEMEFHHKWSAQSLFTAGSDTTAASLMNFFLAMMIFPEIQKKAHEELDRVVGNSRLPVSSDRDNLPYIMGIMKETHRWHPIAPLSVPHASTAEDTCNGYRIPKGAILLPNTWWFTHDPSVYPDPATFSPERYIATPTHAPEPDPREFTYGYGRRVCPGRHVADNAIFITIARALAVFDIAKPVDGAGKVVEPCTEYSPGFAPYPVAFKADIRPRSKRHQDLVRDSKESYPWEESDAKELEKVRWK
ncbi:hypothetical protein PTNB73_09362 [Pyrenophora teres f. teres]|nr:hypothetical protein HRS9139_08962 [Pyrenophora teres f. teres]KAE8834951.1 hypothetical protein PTNB85_06284 [Pyrenophora teres f. teres]KAE8843573.1 hypothetical protein HRS9122_04676 [Pyrenophora teres f. teres]KAE8856640.1 hypothetical protein PTNB73_09362 [Pyrenophora teres f. teres]KAE8861240.1 hypothetical protein PTNB29_06335 [Pyrenophora teres f. teres]